MSKKPIIASLGLAITLLASAAQAEMLRFTLADTFPGGESVSWLQSSDPTPLSYDSHYTYVTVFDYDLGGVITPQTSVSYANWGPGSLDLYAQGFGFTRGPLLFSGSLSSPHFSLGSWVVGSLSLGRGATFTITSVPEISTWVMMGAGFAALGFMQVARRRKTVVAA